MKVFKNIYNYQLIGLKFIPTKRAIFSKDDLENFLDSEVFNKLIFRLINILFHLQNYVLFHV